MRRPLFFCACLALSFAILVGVSYGNHRARDAAYKAHPSEYSGV